MTKKELSLELSNYLKKSMRKKILFQDYCRIKKITSMTQKATLKKIIMSSSAVSYTYELINNVSEMVIILQS